MAGGLFGKPFAFNSWQVIRPIKPKPITIIFSPI